MKKWRYYIKEDETKATIKELYAQNIHEARTIASRMERIEVKDFREYFIIELK
tara:strand:- start:538 stop:696 length:159 start_codon:yes stop_codon:yes gene_type:complete